MRIWGKTLALAAMGALLMWTPPSVSAQPQSEGASEGLCRRPLEPLALPPEPAQREAALSGGSREAPAETARYAPSPSPTPPASVTTEEEESIVVTGTRLARSDFEAIAPVTTPSAEDLPAADAAEARAPAGPEADDRDTDRGSAFQHREHRPQAPEAGLLTAGDHDDLLNPEQYAHYVESFLQHEALAGVPRVDTQRVLSVLVQDRVGRPVPFAQVTLTCGDGNQLTLSTTADGAAVFFPELDRLGARVSITARHGGRGTPMSQSVTLSGRARAQHEIINLEGMAAPVRDFDLAIVVDTTGSMTDELEYLKAELDSILGALRRDHPNLDIRIALVAYRDTGDEYVTRTFPFTGDIAAIQGDLARQRAGGGGDYPEAVEQAMARAVALDWRPDAVRSLLFVADAPPHADDVASTWRSTEAARVRRIQIVPVGASGVGPGAEYMMRAMAAVTQSRYIFLTDDSGIGNPHAPPAVDCYLVTSLETLIRRVLDAQISGRRVEPDDHEIIRTVGVYDHGRCRAPPPLRR